jgi:8-oxo-dGTP pyrophosphatase MutT (NUDIX family)
MRYSDLFENYDPHEAEHFDDLARTGFYGKAGAGCVFLAKSTNRILLAHRSHQVEEPHTWGNWGGALNPGESPNEGVQREAREEIGHSDIDVLEIIPLYVFSSGTFRYHNYVTVVDSEFDPILNWEAQDFRWCDWGHWPQPLHFGLQSLFSDNRSVEIFHKLMLSKGKE